MLHLYDYIKFGSFFALMARNFRIAKNKNKLRSEIVWRRFFAVSAFMLHFRSNIAVRKLLVLASPYFSSRFCACVSFWQGPNILGNIMKLRNTPADKDNLTRLKRPPWTYMKMTIFHYNIWEWLFQLARNSWKL